MKSSLVINESIVISIGVCSIMNLFACSLVVYLLYRGGSRISDGVVILFVKKPHLFCQKKHPLQTPNDKITTKNYKEERRN